MLKTFIIDKSKKQVQHTRISKKGKPYFAGKGSKKEKEEMVTMYHGTSSANAAKIRESGFIRAGMNLIFLTPNKEYAKEYGPEVFEVKVPKSEVEKRDWEGGYGQPELTQEEREYAEEIGEHTFTGDKIPITIGKAIKHQPGYKFDPVKHRWIVDEFKRDLAKQSRGVSKKDIVSTTLSRLIDQGAVSPEARKLPLKQQFAIVYKLRDK